MDYKQRILEEAAVMFRTYGIRAVTMDMLSNKMGISKRTIYEVFSDKDEILKEVLKWMSDKQYELLMKVMNESENVIEAVFKMLDVISNHFQNMSPAFQLDIKRYHNDVLKKLDDQGMPSYTRKNQEIIIERGIKEGIFRNDLDIEITNKCLFEVTKMSSDVDNYLNKDVIMNIYNNYLRGISTQKGLDLINYYEKQYNNKK